MRGARANLVCGGFAIRTAGYVRYTQDIDLLVDTALENEAKVFQALEIFPDKAVMKRHTHRVKDAPDLLFLRQLLEAQGITPPE